MRSSWIRVALYPRTGVLRRGEDMEEKGTWMSHVKIEAEVGVMLPQATEHLEPPKAGRGKEGCSPRAFRGSTAL